MMKADKPASADQNALTRTAIALQTFKMFIPLKQMLPFHINQMFMF